MNSEELLRTVYSTHYKSKNKPFRYIPSFIYKLLFVGGCIFVIMSVPFDPFRNLLLSDVGVMIATAIIGIKLYGRSVHKRGYVEGFSHAASLLKTQRKADKETTIYVNRKSKQTLSSVSLN